MNATALTDVLLAAAALAFAILLRRGRRTGKLWIWGFGLAAAAAGAGSVFHAGHPAVELWNGILVLIGAAIVMFVAAAVAGGLPRGARRTRWVITGAVVTAAGLALQQSPLASHNVIYHLVQIAALYAFYRGAQLPGMGVSSGPWSR